MFLARHQPLDFPGRMAQVDILTDLPWRETQLVAQAQLRLITAAKQPQWDQLMV